MPEPKARVDFEAADITIVTKGNPAFPMTSLGPILQERHRQHEIWGTQDLTPAEWMNILNEETGEATKAVNQEYWSKTTDPAERRQLLRSIRLEAAQTAAVAMAFIDALDAELEISKRTQNRSKP